MCTFTLEHHEFQRKFLAASAILFVWVTNGVILPRERSQCFIHSLDVILTTVFPR
jgi:hypothetical protein